MTLFAEHYLLADWPAPARVKTLMTTRLGGVSTAPFDSLNPAQHVGDDSRQVDANRQIIAATLNQLGDVDAVQWLNQTHSIDVIHSDYHTVSQSPDADACTTVIPNIACAVMTADCLPLLLCRQDGSAVAACHAGWRGLLDGVIEQTVQQLAGNSASPILVWLGPAISQASFEVGGEVRQQFLAAAGNQQAATDDCFIDSGNSNKYLADLYQLARLRLHRLSIDQIFGGELCTFNDRQRFYSYRRDGQTGRLASIIWLD
ncbi:Polyphenol oxidase [Sinobacterium norvegicum]|uniref:Purine nucleoside phosphorylase n=1 Tax=Sinobacterium norvegicum TaxID=1641715 RepID=A0ABN8EMB1_9GAMM|nr:peptidoglycan editing factor PgeF [Sinobacterium norvegicum]CAH0992310.1 Polyphenol oxidase [Sinobacterium norvegicum]